VDPELQDSDTFAIAVEGIEALRKAHSDLSWENLCEPVLKSVRSGKLLELALARLEMKLVDKAGEKVVADLKLKVERLEAIEAERAKRWARLWVWAAGIGATVVAAILVARLERWMH
jgi:hypothetical protein